MARKKRSKKGDWRRQQKIGKRQSRPVAPALPPPPHSEPPSSARGSGCFARFWKAVGAFGLILGIVTAGYVFQPNVSISAEDPLRPRDMLSTPFTIRNDGVGTVWDVRFVCQVDTLATSSGQLIRNNRPVDHLLVSELPRGESVTGGCHLPNFTGNIIGTAGLQQLVRLSIEVTFKHLPMRVAGRSLAGFRTVPVEAGQLQWVRVRAIPIWRPQ